MLESLILYNCDIKAPPKGEQNRQLQASLIKQENLKKLNLSHNDLSGLLGFLGGPAQLLVATLENLTLVNIGLKGLKCTK